MTTEEAKLEEMTDKEYQKTVKILEKRGYTPKDILEFVDGLQKQKSSNTTNYKIGKHHVKFGLFGDTHIGNINYDPPLMKHYLNETKKQKVDFHLNTGDIFDGWYQNRPSSIFEQNAIGFDRQMAMAVTEFERLDAPLYFITGNHSYNTFVRGAGVEAGPYFEDKLRAKGIDANYLGNAEGEVKFGKDVKIRLLHPDGGTAYAISYKSQKIVESFTSGSKPQMLAIGHFHKLEYIFYRNVHTFQTGTLMGQTKFMKGKGIPAHKGFWIVDVYSDNKGNIDKIIPQLYPAYK
jgi:hypothetical protein